MLSPDDVLAEIEADNASRRAEIRQIERFLSNATADDERSMLKRTLILLTYSHVEGFAKFVLSAYAEAINARRVRCEEVTPAIAAASLSPLFAALRDPNSKHEVFRRALPDDAFLHLSAREQEFVSSLEEVGKRQVDIPERAYDTKSNLDGKVLMKLLFQLGLPYDAIDPYRATLNRLVGVRNAIAHGDRIKVPSDDDVKSYIQAAFEIIEQLSSEVYLNLHYEKYLKPPALAGAIVSASPN